MSSSESQKSKKKTLDQLQRAFAARWQKNIVENFSNTAEEGMSRQE